MYDNYKYSKLFICGYVCNMEKKIQFQIDFCESIFGNFQERCQIIICSGGQFGGTLL